jgi:hypothetical protein
MIDRELLELAAKAAEMPHPKWNTVHDYMMVGLGGNTKEWNPLDDDADALRLAVKLLLKIDVVPWGTIATKWNESMYVDDAVPHNDDPYAATRRAIVRAAAQIGRGTE